MDALPPPFTVQLPQFSGSLSELALALRSGQLEPRAVSLLPLTRDVLAWVQEVTGQQPVALARSHPDLLPSLAAVIALKSRLLLPKPEPQAAPDWPDEAPEDWDDHNPTAGGVELLAELETLVSFLSQRRKGREGVIAVKGEVPKLPRRERKRNPQGSLAKLLAAAQQAVRQVEVPLLSRERLTLSDALKALRAFGQRLGSFGFGGITTTDWGERTTYFAALLEGVKEGTFAAEQSEQFGDIEVQYLQPPAPAEEAPIEPAPTEAAPTKADESRGLTL